MRLLGVDYGRAKVGIAIGEGFLAEPYKVIKYKDKEFLVKQIDDIVKKEQIVRIVVGVSESEMGRESANFGKMVNEELNIPVDIQDETLSSLDAQKLSREVGIQRKKRKGLEDAYAATIMLQNYLDTNMSETS